MKSEWLWDSRLTERQAARILKDEKDPRFTLVAEKLISRLSPPKKVFKFIDKKIFCRNWRRIKERLKKDRWLQDKVVFWQMVYEAVLEDLKARGFKLKTMAAPPPDEVRSSIARQIRNLRAKRGYTQKKLARKLGVIQPYISRIEKGCENVSVETLQKIARALKSRVRVKLIRNDALF